MARQSIGVIMQNIGATVNQDPTQPQDASADWVLWLQFLNRAQIEWAEAFDWEVLKQVYFPPLAANTRTSLASIGLPLNYRKLAGPVVNYSTGVDGGESWPEVLPEQRLLHGTVDKFFYIFGDPSNGYSLQWNPGTIASGVTIEINYYSMPTSLVSATQFPVVPDSEFLTQRTIAYVLEARSDPRYQDEEKKARERLLTMIENASVAKYDSYVSPIRILTPENRSGFRFGRN